MGSAMKGEHILELLNEKNARVVYEDRRMYYTNGLYTVYHDKKYAKVRKILIETEDEKRACKILKGE